MGWPHNHSYRNNINTINWIKDRLKNVNIKHIVYVGLVSKHRFRLPSCFWWLELLDLYSPDGAKSLDKLREQQYKHGGIV